MACEIRFWRSGVGCPRPEIAEEIRMMGKADARRFSIFDGWVRGLDMKEKLSSPFMRYFFGNPARVVVPRSRKWRFATPVLHVALRQRSPWRLLTTRSCFAKISLNPILHTEGKNKLRSLWRIKPQLLKNRPRKVSCPLVSQCRAPLDIPIWVVELRESSAREEKNREIDTTGRRDN